SSSKVGHSQRLASWPPYSRGHEPTAQRASNSRRSHSRWAPTPAAESPDGIGNGGLLASSQSRAAARNRSSSADHPMSIRPPAILYPGYTRGSVRPMSKAAVPAVGGWFTTDDPPV